VKHFAELAGTLEDMVAGEPAVASEEEPDSDGMTSA